MISKRKLVPISTIHKKTHPSIDERLKLDIYRFMEIRCRESFRFRELANWLMKNNSDLKNEFIGSPLPKRL